MIVGLILRNFKSFRNQHYIPISIDGYMSCFIGENGVGKSTVLQALETVLNQNDIGKLDVNNETRSAGYATREPLIVPIFMIEKDRFKKGSALYSALETISGITWQLETDDFNLLQRPVAVKFVEHRDKLSKHYNESKYFLIPIGLIKNRPLEVPIPHMSFFESLDDYQEQLESIAEQFPSVAWLKKSSMNDILTKILQEIKALYTYIYLPAEITIDSYSKIESELLQALLGETIDSKIGKIIKQSDITAINKHLNAFIDNVSSILEEKYHFKKPSQRQTQFTQRHMTSKIIETFFSDKILHAKDSNNKDTPITNLSSGEKRRALLDISLAFLKTNPKISQTITVFAIDEPELSLHATACFKQFEKIRLISEMSIQTLITTHWYGFLPVTGKGTATYISPNQSLIQAMNLEFFREEATVLVQNSKGSYLDTLEIKSNYDLVQSIIASITSGNKYNWLICEGKTDKKYLDAHFAHHNITNIIVLPVSGSIALRKIYTYLTMALEDRKKTITGKVYCLIDTDPQHEIFPSSDSLGKIIIRRMILNNETGEIDLLTTGDTNVSPKTAIEDALDGDVFVSTLQSLKEDKTLDFDFIHDDMEIYSGVSGYCLEYSTKEKREFEAFFKEPGAKNTFCDRYIIYIDECETLPKWMAEINSFFLK